MPATAGCPLGSRSERNADRRARSYNARPIKVRTPAPGFSTDSDAREEAGFKNEQPRPSLPRTCQQRNPPAAPSGGSGLNPAPRRTGSDFRARATPPPGTYGFSGVTADQALRHYKHADGCRSAPVVATGCRRCRHRCRQLAPGHPVASRSGPRRAGQGQSELLSDDGVQLGYRALLAICQGVQDRSHERLIVRDGHVPCLSGRE